MSPKKSTVILLAAVALIVAAAAHGSPRSVEPTTVVSFPGIVYGYDENSGRAAWIDSAWILRVRPVRGGAMHSIRYTKFYEEIPDQTWRPRLFVEGHRLLWLSVRGSGAGIDIDHVLTAEVTASTGARVANERHGEGADGSYVTGIAGDAAGFAYGGTTVALTSDQLAFRVVGGGIYTTAGGVARKLPGAPPSIVLARASGRVAAEPVSTEDRHTGIPVAAGTIEIRNLTSGAVISTIATPPARSAVLTSSLVAVLVGNTLTRYQVCTGQQVGSATTLPTSTSPELRTNGRLLALRTPHSVLLVDLLNARVRTVPAAKGWQVVGVALDGQTLSWAESRRIEPGEPSRKTFTTRIRTLPVS
jgi:hypothetical protein